jgi:hypothetical protein
MLSPTQLAVEFSSMQAGHVFLLRAPLEKPDLSAEWLGAEHSVIENGLHHLLEVRPHSLLPAARVARC